MRLELSAATQRFGTTTVFEDVNATFPASTVTALIGPSGSGKSTILSVLAGLRRPTRGNAWWVDDDGGRRAPDAQAIAWVPQGANSLPRRSVLANVMIGPLATGQDRATALRAAAGALASVGLAHLANQRARTLSGGELQRVAVARALASGREVIFADEPTASLDRASAVKVAEAITAPRAGRLLVIATHDAELIDRAQHVIDLGHSRGR